MAAPRQNLADLARQKLRRTLILVLVLVCVPMALIIARTYSQLGAESRFRDRRAAEEVSALFDRQLFDTLKPEEDRPFEDYQFLKAVGSGVQLSPLAQPGARETVPGLVGYFQVQPGGQVTSPILPESAGNLPAYGITPDEEARRRGVLRELESLVSSVSLAQLRETREPPAAQLKQEAAAKDSLLPSQAKSASRDLEERSARKSLVNMVEGFVSRSATKKAAVNEAAKESAEYQDMAAPAAMSDSLQAAGAMSGGGAGGARMESRPMAAAPAPAPQANGLAEGSSAPGKQAVTQFLAVIEPFQATIAGDHLVFFRRVSRDDKLFVQGFVARTEPFVKALAQGSFLTSALAAGAGLSITSGPRQLGSFQPGGRGYSQYSASTSAKGPELARFPVAPPLRQLELVFTGGQGDSSAGSLLLHFLTAAVLAVLLLGFWTVYRASVAQIDLAAERSDFVSAVSHELKTPLTSIRMYAEMLKTGMADPAKQASYYDFILSESERLSRLIGNVLQLAKLSKGVPIAEPKPLNAGQLLDRVGAKAQAQAQAAGFRLEIQKDPAAAQATVLADEDCFTQILLNLVDNALKFSAQAPERKIELGLRTEPGSEPRVAFTVRDHGPGVPKEERKKIFQLFYRAENELTRRTPGTGIGLALVAQLAATMGAAVDMTNREPAGAEFRVIFPKR